MEERITKIILHEDNELEIHHDGLSIGGGMDRMAIKSRDAANPKLYLKLQDMRLHLCRLLKLEKDYAKGMRITGVLLEWDGSQARTVIKAEKMIEGLDKPFKITTPATQYSSTAAMDLEDLCQLAMNFVNGERSQLDLWGQEGMKSPEQKETPAVAPVRGKRGHYQRPVAS